MNINHLSDFKAKVAAGKICQGLVIQLCDPVVAEMAGDIGFDFTWIDAEHCPHTLQDIQQDADVRNIRHIFNSARAVDKKRRRQNCYDCVLRAADGDGSV